MSKIAIGIESTAHTAGVGLITSEGEILSNQRALYVPEEGGIHPREAANHHSEKLPDLFRDALQEANLTPEDISLVSYARGPGLGPCLRTGATAARAFAYSNDIPLLGVNHCVAHLEIGLLEGATDPVLLYLSGANTQVIAYAAGRYRVFGETIDNETVNIRAMNKWQLYGTFNQSTVKFVGEDSTKYRFRSIGRDLMNIPY